MIVIQYGVWRADCVAGIDICEDQVQVYPVGSGEEWVAYDFPTEEEAVAAYKVAVTQWKKEIEGARARFPS